MKQNIVCFGLAVLLSTTLSADLMNAQGPSPSLLPGTPSRVDDGLVAYYRFEGDARDSSGNGSDGAVFGPTFEPGKNGLGSRFTGSSYIEVPHKDNLSPRSALSVSAWVKVFGYPTWHSAVVYKGGEPPTNDGFRDRAYSLWMTRDRGVHFTSTPEGASSQIRCDSPGSLYKLDEFVHVAGVVDTLNQHMVIYVNGKKVQDCAYAGSAIRGGNHPLRIGGPFYSLGDQSGLDGVIDEVRIYDRALSDQEIQVLAGLPLNSSSPRSSALLWRASSPLAGTTFEVRLPN